MDFVKSKLIDFDLESMIMTNSFPDSYYRMEINKIAELEMMTLSGGELQRLMCWITTMTCADVYIFDEPSNFLDVKQRLEVSRLIKSICANSDSNGAKYCAKYCVVIEHDLSMLDYISDE